MAADGADGIAMPRALRIVGTLAAFAWTLLVAVAIVSFVAAFLQPLAILFIASATLLLPFIAAMLLLIFLSYGFAAIVSLTGTGAPITTVGLGYATIYMLLATVIADVTFVLFFIVIGFYAPLVSNGLVLFLFAAAPHLVQVLIAYLAADRFSQSGSAGVDDPGECWFRGNLIGMNGAMNVLLIAVFYPMVFGPLLAILGTGAWPLAALSANIVPILTVAVITAVLGTCLLSATVSPALGAAGFLHDWVKGWAGWLSWLMPMSWPSCLYGWLEFYLCWTLHFISLFVGLLAPWLPTVIGPAAAASVTAFLTSVFPNTNLIAGMRLDNGMITLTGGWGGFIPDDHNAGCFSFVATTSGNADLQYLGGHHLNVAAFGWLFVQLESWLPLAPPRYGTRIAESNIRPALGPREVTVWS